MGKLTTRIHMVHMPEAAAEGLNLVALRVQGVTIPLTPLEYGDLRDSIEVDEATPDHLESAVFTNSPYARRQHEELQYHHKQGQAKFLETAVTSSKAEARAIMVAAAKRALG